MHRKAYTFGRHERIKSKKMIETLFRQGEAFFVFPFKVYFNIDSKPTSDKYSTKIGISVPKKRFKKATDRNRVKRLVREAYRLTKGDMTIAKESACVYMLLAYVSDDILEVEKLKGSFKKIMKRILLEIPDEEN